MNGCPSTPSTDSSSISKSVVPELYGLMLMPNGDVVAHQGVIGLSIRMLSREGKRLDGVGIRRCVVLTNGDEIGVISIGGWVGIMVGSTGL